jgi:CRP-like cAMP-binding protein
MVLMDTSTAPIENQLLARLPAIDLRRLRPMLTTVPLHPKQVLQKQGEPIKQVYFPNSGLVSLTTALADGSLVEAATIGDDGIVGIEAFLAGDLVSPCEAIVQVPVPGQTAEMMNVPDFRREIDLGGRLRAASARYLHVLYTQMARLTACNARHSVNERCARWLLTAQDQVHRSKFHLSQEFLGVMLGVRRQAVSEVATSFRAAGLIRYQHGTVTVMDREALERTACECYAALAGLRKSPRP